jgi:GNAT superfamily N-acetyltransferase
MEASELSFFYNRITQDFPAGEYPPHEILSSQFGAGLQDGLVYCRGKQDLAYSICAANTDYVLLSLFAVLPEFRGQGLGSAFLQALQSKYAGKQAMIGEVERPELASNAAETKLRKWRIEFYEKAGYYLIPAIDYTIWDVPMDLMALPMTAPRKTIDANIQAIMYQIYLQLMGQQFMHKLSFK